MSDIMSISFSSHGLLLHLAAAQTRQVGIYTHTT